MDVGAQGNVYYWTATQGQTKQLPEYTKVKGLERDKIKQMALQFIQNAGEDGTKKNSLLDYLKDVLPQRNSQEQNLRLLGNILSEMNTEGSVVLRGKLWFACKWLKND